MAELFQNREQKLFKNASQHIPCNFDASQELWNVPSRVYSVAACGWAYRLSCVLLSMVTIFKGLAETKLQHKQTCRYDALGGLSN